MNPLAPFPVEQDVVLHNILVLGNNETIHNVPNPKMEVKYNAPLMSFEWEDVPMKLKHLILQDFNLFNLSKSGRRLCFTS